MQDPHNRQDPGPREMTLDCIRTARPFCRSDRHDPRLDQLSARLPPRLRSAFQWLLRPSSAWTRIPAGILLICGGLLGFLPILGLWMLPLGLLLLAEDCRPSDPQELAFWIGSSVDIPAGSLATTTKLETAMEAHGDLNPHRVLEPMTIPRVA